VPTAAEGDGVYVTVHTLEPDPDAVRVHVVLLNVPPFPPSLQVTVPVGVEAAPVLVSATVAVKITGKRIPRVSDVLEGVTLVELPLSTERDAVPELPE